MSNGIINDSFQYNGIVNLSLKIKDKIVNKHIKNNGTILLKRAFAMFMCGGNTASSALAYLPAWLDLRDSNNQSILKKIVPVTSPIYTDITVNSELTCCVEYSASIPYSALKTSISDSGEYRLYLMCNPLENVEDNRDLAYITITSEDLYGFSAGTSAIIAWRLMLLNN